MARDYPTVNDWLNLSSAPVTASPLTLATWIKTVDTTSRGHFSICDGTNNNNRWTIENFNDKARMVVRSTQGSSATTGNTLTIGAWDHICAINASSTSHRIVLNADFGNDETSTADREPSGVIDIVVGGRTDQSAGGSISSMAESAIWNVALVDDEIEALAAGVSPDQIRPHSLVFYLKQIRDADVDQISGTKLTVNGTPVVVSHPPHITYPAGFASITVPAVAGITVPEIVAAATSFDNRPRKPSTIFLPF